MDFSLFADTLKSGSFKYGLRLSAGLRFLTPTRMIGDGVNSGVCVCFSVYESF